MPSTASITEVRPLAVTMGEPAGIGGDIALSAWIERTEKALPPFFIIDDPRRLETLADQLGLKVPVSEIASPGEAAALFPNALPVLPLALKVPSEPGRLDARNAICVIEALNIALKAIDNGDAAGVVTNPIHKQTLYASGFQHPGHTEFLAKATNSTPAMMLSCPGLRVVPITIHVPLSKAPALITSDLIVSRGAILATALAQDFGILKPRIAVAALNPHGGESGALGREENDIIVPAIEKLREAGHDVTGPYPADTLFHAAARKTYDAVLAMYHDQALIPLKTIDFNNGVNTTLGLPLVRTSPDHGTACDIAGTGKAHPGSFIAALHQAAAIAKHRSQPA
jgi:4-hydroxythreonine-4-phosphate dehydrogenase